MNYQDLSLNTVSERTREFSLSLQLSNTALVLFAQLWLSMHDSNSGNPCNFPIWIGTLVIEASGAPQIIVILIRRTACDVAQ